MKISIATFFTGLFASFEMNNAFSVQAPRLASPSTASNVIMKSLHHETAEGERILSDMDIMCIMNQADLCSFYDECDLEEREALLNRFEEQKEILAERIAMMSCLTKHLTTGDHKHLEDEETAKLKAAVLQTVDVNNGMAP